MVEFEKRYLGDGVYASFDGYQVWLHVNHHEAPPCVALEPSVIDALNRYFRDVTRPKPVPFHPDTRPPETQQESCDVPTAIADETLKLLPLILVGNTENAYFIRGAIQESAEKVLYAGPAPETQQEPDARPSKPQWRQEDE